MSSELQNISYWSILVPAGGVWIPVPPVPPVPGACSQPGLSNCQARNFLLTLGKGENPGFADRKAL